MGRLTRYTFIETVAFPKIEHDDSIIYPKYCDRSLIILIICKVSGTLSKIIQQFFMSNSDIRTETVASARF